ncbi:MAG: hypothetical protein ACK5A0_13670 [Polaromonas sp.]
MRLQFSGKLTTHAAKVPACILSASQCAVPELMHPTRLAQALRKQVVA